jgi:tetratricopeptide (TPR) repeat protein
VIQSITGAGADSDVPANTMLVDPASRESNIASAFDEGVAAYSNGSYDLASDIFESVIAMRHDHADAHYRLGLVRFKQREFEDASDCFVLATHFFPDFADAWYGLALVAQQCGDHRRALACLHKAVAARPDFADAFNALGATALASGDIRHAVECFEQTIRLRPEHAHAHSNLGYVLFRDCGEYDRGAAHIRTALALNDKDPDIWCNQTMVLMHEGRLEESISVCNQLLTANPDFDHARLNRALARLRLGQFAHAWSDYEARKTVRSNYIPRPFTFPEWRGEALRGKTILVYAEQGIGDEIMFASCFRDLLAQADRCIFECSPRLEPLFRRSFPEAMVRGAEQSSGDTRWLAALGQIDFQIAAGSLPGHFRHRLLDFPAHGGYLRADPVRVTHWRERLRAYGSGIKVGIAWRGGMPSTRRDLRSIPLKSYKPLFYNNNCNLISLQHGDVGAEAAELRRADALTVHRWQEAVDDLDETAALMEALDLVISVQTATVHLAGALGRPVWVLVPAVPEWRYLQGGSTMPWYPTAMLFRQSRTGDWAPVMERVASELRRFGAAS